MPTFNVAAQPIHTSQIRLSSYLGFPNTSSMYAWLASDLFLPYYRTMKLHLAHRSAAAKAIGETATNNFVFFTIVDAVWRGTMAEGDGRLLGGQNDAGERSGKGKEMWGDGLQGREPLWEKMDSLDCIAWCIYTIAAVNTTEPGGLFHPDRDVILDPSARAASNSRLDPPSPPQPHLPSPALPNPQTEPETGSQTIQDPLAILTNALGIHHTSIPLIETKKYEMVWNAYLRMNLGTGDWQTQRGSKESLIMGMRKETRLDEREGRVERFGLRREGT